MSLLLLLLRGRRRLQLWRGTCDMLKREPEICGDFECSRAAVSAAAWGIGPSPLRNTNDGVRSFGCHLFRVERVLPSLFTLW